ncbi:uncharacterized protein NECHADRAFT_79502 [Fusarium vanettenii 77-13-4]|uniref:F-box domain-containing protein n=1 Tax=Fusarium vanettenii (strain ATCC MYA-4622 / CBS 123669 / FGSC 9596 / NRRL 45880 / 77-13-4) TaxID=660122 RepID=C7Z7N7_FUSV7|nr:uncharacterized protein NECHADRAFT_79502 [Fusarium vanettenii 77-13-4]EEU39859.1 predicted protein [Fusarium vanettenii 77-13-4]
MSFTECSTEILLQICEEFCQHCQEKHLKIPRPDWFQRDSSRQALLNLSSTGGDRQRDDIVKFCRTISNNPELGKCLRWANLSVFGAKIHREVIQAWLPDALEKVGHHLALDVPFGLEHYPNRAISPLVLLKAPNIERVDDDGKNQGSFFHMLAWHTGTVVRDGALPQNLNSVQLGGWVSSFQEHDEFYLDLSFRGLGYLLSSLQKLHTLTIYCPGFEAGDDRVLFQHLRVLRLGEFLMRRDDFERLISCTPLLEEFAHFYFGVSAEVRGDTATIPEICMILTQRKKTLRRLMLDASCTVDDLDHLRRLENLEELKIWAGPSLTPQQESDRIDSQALVDALPPSLRKLHVKVKIPGLDMAGEALMTYISSTYRRSRDEQKLKQVYFDVYEEPARRYIPFKKTLEKRCREWIKHGTVVFSVRRFAWYDIGDWGSGEGTVDEEDNRDL